jgi:Outer membrane protein beta-barrel domain
MAGAIPTKLIPAYLATFSAPVPVLSVATEALVATVASLAATEEVEVLVATPASLAATEELEVLAATPASLAATEEPEVLVATRASLAATEELEVLAATPASLAATEELEVLVATRVSLVATEELEVLVAPAASLATVVLAATAPTRCRADSSAGHWATTGKWAPGSLALRATTRWQILKGSSNTCGANSPVPHACATKVESLGTLRGFIGNAVGATGNWLPYVTGGLAVGELRAWDNLFPASGSECRAGWTLGGGLKVGITQNWVAKVEYLYVDLGNRQMLNVIPGVPETVSFTANIIRAGIDIKFY